MKIQFFDQPVAFAGGFVVQPMYQDSLPEDPNDILAAGAKASRFSGKAGQVFESFVAQDGHIFRLARVGLGKRDATNRLANCEKAGAALSAKYLRSGEGEMRLDLHGLELSSGEVAALLLGLRLRAWSWDHYKTKQSDEQKATLASVSVMGAPDGCLAAWSEAEAIAQAVEFTRELVTQPANILYPISFVERCQARMADTGIAFTVLDENDMGALGMGALLGVSQGSPQPPRLLAMRWNGGEDGIKPTVFVGKGVTFDTGGISLKPPAGMEDMKWDMGGAGAVAGAMLALALRGAKANVIGICGLVENMPDGHAQRPGDVVTSMSGQTIEVINTDAEGRLVLCDALTWAQREYTPAAIVDLATLTGAMIVSLGFEYGGMFANDDDLAEKLAAAGTACGDKLWRMPMGSAYDKQIDSPIADMKNVGPRYGGSITAAQFLARFIDKGTAWAHLDIAGTVWAEKPGATWDKGATGFGVRLLNQYVRDNLEG